MVLCLFLSTKKEGPLCHFLPVKKVEYSCYFILFMVKCGYNK